ncbi:MAG: hypothetical protein ABIQ59_03215 [Nocardioidaceae bacterium]
MRLLVALVALVASTTVVPPATASDVHREAVITFHKNYANTFRSTLTWELFRVESGRRTSMQKLSWRAGAGYFRDSTDACRKNNGWLPDGTYQPRLARDYGGNLIKGRAIYLGQKQCANGTMRTDLFIHTEQGAGSRQCANRPGDQVCRWEYPRINDYRSYGCIKLSPGDLHELYDAWRRWFSLGSTPRVIVRVG